LAFASVARAEDVPEGRGLCVRVGTIDVGLFRVAGEIVAIENRCPHAGDPLSEGRLDGAIVTCPNHGWRFDVRSGFRPDDADGFPIPRFGVRVRAGEVEVDLEQVLNRRPRRTTPPRASDD
jgi:nitrite reductase/ring-hydroxylating ferredoxin subunit